MKLAELRNLKIPQVSVSDLPSRYRVFFIPAVAIVISLLLLLIAARPRLNSVLQLRKEVKEEETRLENIRTKADELASLDKIRLSAEVKLVNRALPFEKDVSAAVIGMERLAADSGLLIDTIALSPGEVSTPSATPEIAGEVDIKTSFSGPFSQIKQLTGKIRQSLRVFSVKEAVISIKGSDSTNLTASFTIASHFSPLAKTAGKIDTPLPKLTDAEKQTLAKIVNYQFVSSVPVSTSGARVDPFARF